MRFPPAKGELTAHLRLDSSPVWDGMATANSHLFLRNPCLHRVTPLTNLLAIPRFPTGISFAKR